MIIPRFFFGFPASLFLPIFFMPFTLVTMFQYSAQAEQGTVEGLGTLGSASGFAADSPNLAQHIKSAVRDVLRHDFNLSSRTPKHIISSGSSSSSSGSSGASDALFHHLNHHSPHDGDVADYPLHEPTGEKTRKTYDFTRE